MEFIKRPDRYDAVNPDGILVGYIERNYIGTHGHSAGWRHYTFLPKYGRIVYAGLYELHGSGIPVIFHNIKDFKDYYNGGN